ncbi:LacI family DNA-binding transcriptional regulator [Paracoccus albus]|uniref:LacI family DNA-binding transcriptional regulator n=1 Tax=Paracoccus albus TaxID=3017784 RepID=UPI0022F0BE74|nr:LacI family DNA-binding transcriptional regulator [Paracoccus albus]WBU59834.1 LacI family DNA-binding transcriptional regulator [Paracoccus albus]
MAKKNHAPVTLKSVAEELNVSVTTVARALKDGHKISPAMVQRVRDTAERMGYVRNLEGAKLRSGKTLVIIPFLQVSQEEEVGDSGSVGLLNGIHDRLSHSDYAVRAVPTSAAAQSLERIQETVRGRLADGIILDHIAPQDARVSYLRSQGFPFVTFGRTDTPDRHAWFDIDNEHAAWQGTDALLRGGHRRIALLDGDPQLSFVHQRLHGYQRALRDHGIEAEAALQRHGVTAADMARKAARDLLEQGADGFVCVNELVFLGALAGVRDKRGGDIGGIGFSLRSGTNLASYVASHAFASHYSRQQAGWHLADLLLRQITGDNVANCQKLVRTELRPS